MNPLRLVLQSLLKLSFHHPWVLLLLFVYYWSISLAYDSTDCLSLFFVSSLFLSRMLLRIHLPLNEERLHSEMHYYLGPFIELVIVFVCILIIWLLCPCLFGSAFNYLLKMNMLIFKMNCVTSWIFEDTAFLTPRFTQPQWTEQWNNPNPLGLWHQMSWPTQVYCMLFFYALLVCLGMDTCTWLNPTAITLALVSPQLFNLALTRSYLQLRYKTLVVVAKHKGGHFLFVMASTRYIPGRFWGVRGILVDPHSASDIYKVVSDELVPQVLRRLQGDYMLRVFETDVAPGLVRCFGSVAEAADQFPSITDDFVSAEYLGRDL